MYINNLVGHGLHSKYIYLVEEYVIAHKTIIGKKINGVVCVVPWLVNVAVSEMILMRMRGQLANIINPIRVTSVRSTDNISSDLTDSAPTSID